MTHQPSQPMTIEARIAAYRGDSPFNGGHSDAAGADAYELLQEAEAEIESLRAELASARKALKEAHSCIGDIGSGKGGWAWEEVLQNIDAALGQPK